MDRAHRQAFSLSTIPGNRRRSSIAADSSPRLLRGGANRGGVGF
jgi:hypothetical protein